MGPGACVSNTLPEDADAGPGISLQQGPEKTLFFNFFILVCALTGIEPATLEYPDDALNI